MRKIILLLFVFLIFVAVIHAQTTEFTYQGKLTDNSMPANSNYDFEFRLFITETGGTAIGTLQRLSVPVSSGIFTVGLDFGAQFDGTARYLEIAVKPAGSGSFITLTPRQPITSAPYNIRSLSSATSDIATNSLQLGGVAANQYVVTTDSRLSDARNPLPNSPNYIQNTTTQQSSSNFNISGNGTAKQFISLESGLPPFVVTSTQRVQNLNADLLDGFSSQGFVMNQTIQQPSSNFNISGDGTAAGTLSGNIVKAATQFNISGSRILSNSGFSNLFVGEIAGGLNQNGSSNVFVGFGAGENNVSGSFNAFFGAGAGRDNTASENSFFGYLAGASTTVSGSQNSFFGKTAGENNTNGIGNSFFGTKSGISNTTGDFNTIIGFSADVSTGNLTNAGAIGSMAFVSQSNSLVLGSINGINGATADTKVGIGMTAPSFKLHVIDPSNTGLRVQTNTAGGTVASFGGNGEFNIDAPFFVGGRFRILEDGSVFINNSGNSVTTTKLRVNGIIGFTNLGVSGSTQLCHNASNQISTCSSSLRYKTNIAQFSFGLSFIKQLRPITFDWKAGGMRDVGFGAEDVARINTLFVTYNDKGEVEGVKYDRLGVAFVNAIKEQQQQIEAQAKLIQEQQKQIDELRQMILSRLTVKTKSKKTARRRK